MASITSSSNPFKKPIRTAACLIIGDEVLNGKTVDTNSPYFAKYCFNLGIELKRIETIADDESEIIEAALRMSKNYDFVVTSGGIGPTHDDITYPSLAKAFGNKLELHEPTMKRMKQMRKRQPGMENFDWETPSAALTARQRMALLPTGEGATALFVSEEVWVPVCIVGWNVHILPGVPRIFMGLLEALKPSLEEEGRVDPLRRMVRVLISTPERESEIAEYLTALQGKVAHKGVKVGSYPRWEKKRNTVTLVGVDREYIESLVAEVEKGVNGKRVLVEGEDDVEELDTVDDPTTVIKGVSDLKVD